MTVKEFKNSDLCKDAKSIRYYDVNGVDISYKSQIMLDLLEVIGSSHGADGSIDVDVLYTE